MLTAKLSALYEVVLHLDVNIAAPIYKLALVCVWQRKVTQYEAQIAKDFSA